MTRYDTIRHDTTRHDTTRHDTTRHDTTRHDTTRHDTTRHDTTRHDTTRHDTTRHDTTQYIYIDVVAVVKMSFVPLSACDQTCKSEDQDGPNAHMLIGAVVAGPGIDDAFPDIRTDMLRNNVSITYNAGFQSTVASTCTSFTHYLK